MPIAFWTTLLMQGVNPGAVQPQSVLLWQGLHEGMTADDVATAIKSIGGVKDAKVKASSREPAIAVSYLNKGIDVDGLAFHVTTTFKEARLIDVRLQSEACLALATEKFKELQSLLGQKYGDSQVQREVTEDRQLIAIRDTFSATPTRVLLRLEPGSIPQHVYGATGLAGALAAINNSSADAAIEACPNDGGQKATIFITYVSNASAAAIDAAAAADEAAKHKQDQDKL